MAVQNSTVAPMAPNVTHPLFALIPADQLVGDLIEVVEVGDGLVTVVATPDSEWGAYEIIGWRALSQVEIDIDTLYFGEEPIDFATYVTATSVQDDSEIPARVAEAVEYTAARLAELAA